MDTKEYNHTVYLQRKETGYLKEWRDKNREHLNELSRRYYQEKIEYETARNRAKVRCDICDCDVNKKSLGRHQKGNRCKTKT
jgi:hypothetical protein